MEIPFESGNIRPSECISEAWELIKGDYWLFMGISLMAWVMAACVPCVNIFIMGPVFAGLYYCFFTKMDNQNVEFGMLFKGFDKLVPAMVIGIIQSVPGIIYQGFQFSLNFAGGFAEQIRDRNFFAQNSDILAGGILAFAILAGGFVLIFFYAWHITFFFALPLLVENDLDIMDAIKLGAQAGWSNWGMLIVLGILQGLVAILGVLALCVGAFFVLPVIFASNAIAFRQVFPKAGRNYRDMPPSPDVFGAGFGTAK